MTEEQEQRIVCGVLTILWDIACKGQTKPDGNNCAICTDNDHQAFECRLNCFRLWEERYK